MNLDSGSLVEIIIATVAGLAAVGLTVLRFAMGGLERQHNATRQLIEEKFTWAELQRKEARAHWEDLFAELKKDDDDLARRVGQIESRVIAIELSLTHRQVSQQDKTQR
jgi:uncharacterized membrane-anchored protein YhcB (DUF1043 family)